MTFAQRRNRIPVVKRRMTVFVVAQRTVCYECASISFYVSFTNKIKSLSRRCIL